jgi:hypothetical protein
MSNSKGKVGWVSREAVGGVLLPAVSFALRQP